MNFVFEGETKNGKEFIFTIPAKTATVAIIETALYMPIDKIDWSVLHIECDFPFHSYFNIDNGKVVYMNGEHHAMEII